MEMYAPKPELSFEWPFEVSSVHAVAPEPVEPGDVAYFVAVIIDLLLTLNVGGRLHHLWILGTQLQANHRASIRETLQQVDRGVKIYPRDKIRKLYRMKDDRVHFRNIKHK